MARLLVTLTDSIARTHSNGTIANIPIGAADPNRRVVILVQSTSASSSFTIGGVNASTDVLVHYEGEFAGFYAHLISAVVPTGTTASLVCSTGECYSYGAWAITGGATSLVSGGGGFTSGTGNMSGFLSSLPANSALIAHAGSYRTAGAASHSWTGVKESFDSLTQGGFGDYYTGAYAVLGEASEEYEFGLTHDQTVNQNVHLIGAAYAGPEVTTVFLTDTGAGSWTVPDDFTSDNTIEVIGGGGGNATGSTNGGAGGGGAYSRIDGLSLTPGASVSYSVGAGGAIGEAGGDTWFNGESLAESSVGAKGGGAGSGDTGGAGGAAASGVGTIKYSGGRGGNGGSSNGGGGGGAGGPYGDGGNGGQVTDSSGGAGGGGGGGGTAGSSESGTTGGNGGKSWAGVAGGTGGASLNDGGNGTAGSGGGGSGATALTNGGGDGGAGIEWDSTHGAGGGGGGGGSNAKAGDGGLYGGGSGGHGSNNSNGTGAQGIIVITYVPVTGETYEESMSLAMAADLAHGPALVLSPSFSLSAETALSTSLAAQLAAQVSLAAGMGAAAASDATLAASVSMAVLAGASPAAQAVYAEALTLAAEAGISQAGQRQLLAALSFGVAAGAAAGSVLTFEDALTLAVEAGFAQGNTLIAQAAASLAVAVSQAASGGGAAIDESIAFAVSTLIDAEMGRTIEADASFGARLGAQAQSAVDWNTAVTLAAKITDAVENAVTFAAGLTFGAVADLQQDGRRVISGTLTLSADLAQDTAVGAVFAGELSFSVAFDAVAAVAVTHEAAVSLAVAALIQSGVLTKPNVVDVSAVFSTTVDLDGLFATESAVLGTARVTIEVSGRS